MLSRVADSLYWMSRYLERAQHTARLIDVNLNQMLDQSSADIEQGYPGWERMLLSLKIAPPESGVNDAYAITELLTFDTSLSDSIVSCIGCARENARQVREQISSEMWEQLNRLFLQVNRTSMEEMWYTEPHAFLASVRESVHLFQGITDDTMSHSEGWHFIRVGRFLERATTMAALLDAYFHPPVNAEQQAVEPLDYFDGVGLLKSCSSFEAYLRVYMATIQPRNIAEFLLLNAESPRSVRFSAAMLQTALQAISKLSNTRHSGRAERLAGRLRATLEYDQIDEIILSGTHYYLEHIQQQCAQIHTAIYQAYITYPIDIMLVS